MGHVLNITDPGTLRQRLVKYATEHKQWIMQQILPLGSLTETEYDIYFKKKNLRMNSVLLSDDVCIKVHFTILFALELKNLHK